MEALSVSWRRSSFAKRNPSEFAEENPEVDHRPLDCSEKRDHPHAVCGDDPFGGLAANVNAKPVENPVP